MNKKRILILVIAILLLLGATAAKIYYDAVNKEYYFNAVEIKNIKKDILNNDILDEITYKDNIITDNILSINYNFFDEKESISGKIYIENGYLYISNSINNYVKKLSNIKFKTMYKKECQYMNIYIYLISESNDLYYFELASNDIKDANINKIITSKKIKNFVNIEFIMDIFDQYNTLFFLAEDGNIYDVTSKFRYDKSIKSIYNKFYVFEDNTITNIYGNPLKNKLGNEYKIKYTFAITEDSEFVKNGTILIITTDNKLIYINDDNNLVYEFQEKVKSIDFNAKLPYEDSKLTITFDDDSEYISNASCNQYYNNLN